MESNAMPPGRKDHYTIVVYGASISRGVIYDDEQQKHSLLLESFSNLVRGHLKGVVYNAAKFGNTIVDGLLRLQRDVLRRKPDIVLMEGIYATGDGNGFWGEQLVAKKSGKYDPRPGRNTERFSFFMGINAGFAVLTGGVATDSSIIFEGYWRFAVNLQTGLLRCTIQPNEGAWTLLNNLPADTAMIIRGAMSFGSADPGTQFQFRFVRKLSGSFDIYAHRGVQYSDVDCHVGLGYVDLISTSTVNGITVKSNSWGMGMSVALGYAKEITPALSLGGEVRWMGLFDYGKSFLSFGIRAQVVALEF
jgi:hypothetical protein